MTIRLCHHERKTPPETGSAGFTILETVIGIFVFTVGILAVANMQTHSISANAKARTMSEAAALASSNIAELRPVGYNDQAMTGDNQDGTFHPRNKRDEEHDPYDVGYRVRRLADLDDEAAVITMNVSWSDHGTAREEIFHYFKIDEYKD